MCADYITLTVDSDTCVRAQNVHATTALHPRARNAQAMELKNATAAMSGSNLMLLARVLVRS